MQNPLTGTKLELDAGAFDAATFNVSLSTQFAGSASTVSRKLKMGTGNTWTLSGGDTVWDLTAPTGMTLEMGSATVSITSAAQKSFFGGGFRYSSISAKGGTQGVDLENLDFDTLTVTGVT